MGPEGAVNIIYRRELGEAEDVTATRAELVADYKDLFANPIKAAELGYVDAIIEPVDTRRVLANALDALASKRDENPPKKHGNIPL
jgi:propionyl-CoA carboxylase beta chain